MHLTLLVLAAGMGSRYGGLKQLDPMGPNGETVLDYSVYDAIRAGFDQVIFVIRREFEVAFRQSIGARFEHAIDVHYAFQVLEDLPYGHTVPKDRQKPWGTAHAVRAARHSIETPFAVINADDFYGQDAYVQITQYFANEANAGSSSLCMVGYPLQNTLSKNGSVNRGVCRVQKGFLLDVEEHLEIEADISGSVSGHASGEQPLELSPKSLVSMNFWGFTPDIFHEIESYFTEFLDKHGEELQSECYLPAIVNSLIQSRKAECKVLKTNGTWFGVTYPGDKPQVQANISALIAKGAYPKKLEFVR